MFKIGLEKEFFIAQNGNLTYAPTGLPFDESGLLAEARGLACDNIIDAVFSLKADIFRLEQIAKKLGVDLIDAAIGTVPKSVKIKASRIFPKGLTKHQNMYGFEAHRNSVHENTAGIHISFTRPQKVLGKEGYIEYFAMFDYIQIFRRLDLAFKEEIRDAKRNPGFYELKPDGRIEYRSLPSTVNLNKVIEVLKDITHV